MVEHILEIIFCAALVGFLICGIVATAPIRRGLELQPDRPLHPLH